MAVRRKERPTGFRLQAFDDFRGLYHGVHRDAQRFGNRRISLALEIRQMVAHDHLNERSGQPQLLNLQQEALLEIARSDAGRIESLNHLQGLETLRHRRTGRPGEIFERHSQVSLLVEIADDGSPHFLFGFVQGRERELPEQMFLQRLSLLHRLVDGGHLVAPGTRSLHISIPLVVIEILVPT